MEQPVIWNVGIGPAASFVPTLTRLLLDRTKDTYGPYDHITRVRLPTPVEAASSTTAQHRLALDVLTDIVLLHGNSKQLQELKQLASEESYFGYGNLSDNLMLQVFGQRYIDLFASATQYPPWTNPFYDRQPFFSPLLERTREALIGKRHLLLVENLHVPFSLDVLDFILRRWGPSVFQNQWGPSVFQNQRWIISTNSKDVFEKSRDSSVFHLTREFHFAPPFDDLRGIDWAVLIKEALRDAARSINIQLSEKGHREFWLHVAQRCLYYAILYHPLEVQGLGASNTSSITSDELVRCWVAQNLLFSPAISTKSNTAAAIGKKQSNYYRSAYEAGKVIIQALQEYSLLPFYSIPLSSQDVITGVSKLAGDVPCLKQDALTTHQLGMEWVSFLNDKGRHVSCDWRPREARGEIKMTTLILRGCSNILAFPLDKLLTPHLSVLDLSHTSIYSLPPSFSNLLNLCLLSLRGCSQLETLSPPPPTSDKETSPLAHLENLQVLDMNGVPLLELTQQDGSNKGNMHYLDLSGSQFTTLPSEFFCEMSSLEELIFGNCTNLIELPPSIAHLSNLLVLHVEGTQITSFPEHMFQKMQSLHTLKLINNMLLMSLPTSLSETSSLEVLHLCNCTSLRSLSSSLHKSKTLKELHISNCISLRLQALWELPAFLENLYIQSWEALEDITIPGHPNLRTFSLSGPWVRCLSLRGCIKLKSVNFNGDLTALEDVDLSGTAIEEVPHNLPNLPQLNKLLLVGVPCFMRFPCHQLVRFPKVFYLDHRANEDSQIQQMFGRQKTCGDEDQHIEKTTNTAQFKINDPRMFHSFNEDAARKLVEEGQFFQSFNVQVKPSIVTGKEPWNSDAELFTRIQRHSTHRDIHFVVVDRVMPRMELQPTHRHVEISAVNQFPNGLRHILSVTNSILITDDNFIRCLTDLNYRLNKLKECQLQHCHQMEVIFLMHSRGSDALPYLERLLVFDLNNLLSVVEPSDLQYSRFITLKLLKHIHLEHCPRLEKLFPCSLSLPALETLVILFCSNLKTIFYKQHRYDVAPSPLPRIQMIYLQELPQLLHIHDDAAFQFETLEWKKLFVRGCRSLRHLPVLNKEYQKSKVEVNGEREWWNSLQLKLPEQSHYYMYVAPPEFASRKKHIIESYLR